MYHEVTHKLAMTSASTAVIEYSRAVPMGGDNAAGFEFWLLSSTGELDDVTVKMQGSNDLSNWTDITGGSLTITNIEGPTHQRVSDVGVLPWSYVRLHYAVTDPASINLMLRAGVELFTRS